MHTTTHTATSPKAIDLSEPDWVRFALIGLTLAMIGLFLILPLVTVLSEAFSKGWSAYGASLSHPDTLAAIRLTLLTAAVTVPLTTVFGISAAWAIARFDFRGKNLLISLIDLPFSVSPV
ncbi:MAG: sulfate/thiosulfate ABC transporter permease CysW, partial [Gammaproteobacteria bacterium]